MKILLINGPNLQLLGKRDPKQYGTATLTDLENNVKNLASEFNVDLFTFQSNEEGAIVDRISDALNENVDGIIINPAAYTHTSVAIRDAIEAVQIPTIEVHISNIHSREDFRHKSLTAPVCMGQISGLGIDGYTLALRALIKNKGDNYED